MLALPNSFGFCILWNDTTHILLSDQLRTSVVLDVLDRRPALLRQVLQVLLGSRVTSASGQADAFLRDKRIKVLPKSSQLLYTSATKVDVSTEVGEKFLCKVGAHVPSIHHEAQLTYPF